MSDQDLSIPEPARRLDRFLGSWDVSGAMSMGGQSSQITGRWQFRHAADRHGIRMTGVTTIEGVGTIEEEELIGYDPADERLHLFSLNRLAVRDHVGDWKDDKLLQVEYRGVHDGRRTIEVITIAFADDGMSASVLETVDGELAAETTLALIPAI